MRARPETTKLLTEYYAAMEANDPERFGSYYADDMTLTFNSDPEIRGRERIMSAFSAMLDRVVSLGHDLVNAWEEDDGVVFFESMGRWTLHNGVILEVKAASRITIVDGRFTDQRIFVDNARVDEALLQELRASRAATLDAGSHRSLRSRLIVTGVDDDGRSVFLSDEPTSDRLVGDGYTRNQLWQGLEVPTPVTAPNGPGDASVIPPPPNGYGYDITAFAPDSEWDYEAGYARLLAQSGVTPEPGDAPGMHTTETIDIVSVISGEVHLLVDEGEKLLQAGDTTVIRGVKHAWSNRSDQPCVISAVHISAVR
ncbi:MULTISPECIES: nuclear transport factor 2 family protein [unclassified Rathayibacter]|uniref:nuclear transport factor 2 family protein n=1 Tax=unclassified Rathayibacter TaxID=2609250 RepID=UPI000A9C566B|nr:MULTISPECIES: nuclear transport factor 2 family protein [unclassified Rathayibacter]